MNWRQVALIIALSVAEASILTPVVAVSDLRGDGFGTFGGMALVAAALIAIALARRIATSYIANPRLALMPGLGVALCIFGALIWRAYVSEEALSDPRWLLPVLLTVLVTWRAGAIGMPGLTPARLLWRFQVGVLILVMETLTLLLLPGRSFVGLIVSFFAAWLVALPLVHLEDTRKTRYGSEVRGRGWLAWIAGVTGLSILLSTIVIALATGTPARVMLGIVLAILSLPIVLLLWLLPDSLTGALGENLGNALQQFQRLQPPPQPAQDPATMAEQSSGLPLSEYIGYALLALIVIGAILYLINSLGKFRRDDGEEARAGATVSGALEDERIPEAIRRTLSTLGLRQWLAKLTVRRLYVRVVHEAGKRGARRAPAQTPSEFLPALQKAFPDARAEAALITDAYIAAHYGQAPDSPEAVERLKAAWERMRMPP
jgi:hypothetical protein